MKKAKAGVLAANILEAAVALGAMIHAIQDSPGQRDGDVAEHDDENDPNLP